MCSDEHASDALADEQQIIRTGEPIVGKVEQETFSGRPDTWVSTTKMPLRDERGRIIGTFGISRDITAQISAEKALVRQALHDPLTGLANRIALTDRLAQALLAKDRHPSRLAVLFIDLDNFKEINDCFGHDAGDLVLAEAARRLSVLAWRPDTVARFGGDEFVIMSGELDDDVNIGLLGDRVNRAIAVPYVESGRDLSVTCSVGIAVASDLVTEPDQLICDADTAMYKAKEAGRNRYLVYSPAYRTRGERNHFHAELCRAIEDSELFLSKRTTRATGLHDVIGPDDARALSRCEAKLNALPHFMTEIDGLIYFNEVDRGCHFAAWQEPVLFSAEVRAGFRSLR